MGFEPKTFQPCSLKCWPLCYRDLFIVIVFLCNIFILLCCLWLYFGYIRILAALWLTHKKEKELRAMFSNRLFLYVYVCTRLLTMYSMKVETQMFLFSFRSWYDLVSSEQTSWTFERQHQGSWGEFLCVYVYVFVHVCVCMCVCVCVCARAHMCMCVHVCLHAYVYIFVLDMYGVWLHVFIVVLCKYNLAGLYFKLNCCRIY